MNILTKYLVKKRENQLREERGRNQESARLALHMQKLGICPDCEGSGAFEDERWGTIRCRTCCGTGKKF